MNMNMNMNDDGSRHDKKRRKRCMNQGGAEEITGSSGAKKLMNVEGDKLSSLSDDLIHKIFSHIGFKQVVQTSVLSSRWRFIWTSSSYLDFSSKDFCKLPEFSKFVTHVLSHRNNQIDVSFVKLTFRGKVSQACVKKIMDYAFSHNIQQLHVTRLLDHDTEFPLSVFSSQTLKHLSLTKECTKPGPHRRRSFPYYLTITSTWELPALTTLCLHDVTLWCDNDCVGLFSKCANLKSLTLINCTTRGLKCITICHPQLSNLTLENRLYHMGFSNVAARPRKFVISAPNLASLVYKGYSPLKLRTDGFHSLNEADICVSSPYYHENAHQIISLLEQLHNVKFLKLNLEIVEALSSSKKLISHVPSPFVNLKSVNIYPESENRTSNRVSSKVKRYLLDSSPSATFTMVLPEEIKAQKLMAELRVFLDQKKAKLKTKRARIKQALRERDNTKMQPQIGGNMAQIKSCWEYLSAQIMERKKKACLIISKLHDIEELLKKLPASNRAKVQSCFSGLCEEAEVLINKITDRVKIQCDKSQSRVTGCFRELATTLQPSS